MKDFRLQISDFQVIRKVNPVINSSEASTLPRRALHHMVYRAEQLNIISNGVN
jgi:hypothetical protein